MATYELEIWDSLVNLKKSFVQCFLLLMLGLTFGSLQAKQIHREKSLYRNVVIVEEDNKRCMRFETRRKRVSNQACIDLKNKDRLVFEYAHGIMAGLAHNPKPQRVLVIGLGGGMLQNAIHKVSPSSEIVSVEIDPVVVKLARTYFAYQESNKIKTIVKDGRVYVKRALLKKEQFDWIILDAFNGDYIPEHLMTKEFLAEVKGLLTPNGLLSANTFSNSKLYDYESVTYQSVFPKLQIYQAPSKGNRVIFGCNCQSFRNIEAATDELERLLKPLSVNLARTLNRISDEITWDTSARILTDQFSPANLLKYED